MAYRFKTYQGKFVPKNPAKYVGQINDIRFRSMWEYQLMRWCDLNDDILKYSSEEIVIPYKGIDGKRHRYFVDMLIEFKSGAKVLVEVKPKNQLLMPRNKQGKKRETLMEELAEYAKNKAKWEAAEAYAKMHGLTFQVWTEDTLKKIGILLDGR